jgi:hypothetical protein
MDQLTSYTLKSLAMIPVVVGTAAVLIATPVMLSGTMKTRTNHVGFFTAFAVGAGLIYASAGLMGKGVNKITGDPGPFTPVVKAPRR